MAFNKVESTIYQVDSQLLHRILCKGTLLPLPRINNSDKNPGSPQDELISWLRVTFLSSPHPIPKERELLEARLIFFRWPAKVIDDSGKGRTTRFSANHVSCRAPGFGSSKLKEKR